mgnify:CR=1 FL=1
MANPGLPYLAEFNLSCKPQASGGGNTYGGGGGNPVGPDTAPHLREVTLSMSPPTDTTFPRLSEITLSTDYAVTITELHEVTLVMDNQSGIVVRSEDQALGPSDSDQSPGRMRHGKFFKDGKLRKVGQHNRRTR